MEAGQDMMGGEGLGPGSGVQVGSPPWVLVGPAMALEVQDGGKLWPSEAQDLIPPPPLSFQPVLLGPQPSCTVPHRGDGVRSTHNNSGATAFSLGLVLAECCPLSLAPYPISVSD